MYLVAICNNFCQDLIISIPAKLPLHCLLKNIKISIKIHASSKSSQSFPKQGRKKNYQIGCYIITLLICQFQKQNTKIKTSPGYGDNLLIINLNNETRQIVMLIMLCNLS